jgi:DNA-binding transcriptional ArsR family regulator
MILLSTDHGQLSRARFAVSPLCYLISAAHAVHNGTAPGWVSRRWASLPSKAVALIDQLIGSGGRYYPDFLTPLPATHGPDLAHELAALVSTPASRVALELSFAFRVGPPSQGFAAVMGVPLRTADAWRRSPSPLIRAAHDTDPAPLLTGLAQTLEEIWRVLLAPSWQLIEDTIEMDLALRSRSVLAHGMAATVGELSQDVVWAPGPPAPNTDGIIDLRGWAGNPILVPNPFVTTATVAPTPGGDVLVTYPCRGRGGLASTERSDLGVRPELSAVVGGTRARLLAALAKPSTGADLARDLRLAPATISYHLGRLHEAGLVRRAREGQRVIYQRIDDHPSGLTETDTAERTTG